MCTNFGFRQTDGDTDKQTNKQINSPNIASGGLNKRVRERYCTCTVEVKLTTDRDEAWRRGLCPLASLLVAICAEGDCVSLTITSRSLLLQVGKGTPSMRNGFTKLLVNFLVKCKSDISSLDFVVNRCFMKLFQTNNIDIVNYCRAQFEFDLPSTVVGKRSKKFVAKYR